MGISSVQDYMNLVNEPWGKIFYDLLFRQLNLPVSPRLKILDFGSGPGVTSNYFATWHEVTAVEPSNEMVDSSHKQNPYTTICGGIESLAGFEDNGFDMVFCHNVLEYVEKKEPIIAELMRVLKIGASLSLVKHNRVGKVLHSTVFENDPVKAMSLIDNPVNDKSNYLGTQYLYSNDDAATLAAKYGGKIHKILGIRAFYALGQDNAVKYDDEWYQNMLALETKVAAMDDYKNMAYLNHLLIEKIG